MLEVKWQNKKYFFFCSRNNFFFLVEKKCENEFVTLTNLKKKFLQNSNKSLYRYLVSPTPTTSQLYHHSTRQKIKRSSTTFWQKKKKFGTTCPAIYLQDVKDKTYENFCMEPLIRKVNNDNQIHPALIAQLVAHGLGDCSYGEVVGSNLGSPFHI